MSIASVTWKVFTNFFLGRDNFSCHLPRISGTLGTFIRMNLVSSSYQISQSVLSSAEYTYCRAPALPVLVCHSTWSTRGALPLVSFRNRMFFFYFLLSLLWFNDDRFFDTPHEVSSHFVIYSVILVRSFLSQTMLVHSSRSDLFGFQLCCFHVIHGPHRSTTFLLQSLRFISFILFRLL